MTAKKRKKAWPIKGEKKPLLTKFSGDNESLTLKVTLSRLKDKRAPVNHMITPPQALPSQLSHNFPDWPLIFNCRWSASGGGRRTLVEELVISTDSVSQLKKEILQVSLNKSTKGKRKSVGQPCVIGSSVGVRAVWSSWGRSAFCTALRWGLKAAWWEAAQTPRRSHRCTCPSAPLLTPPWAAPQGGRSAGGPGASSPLPQTSTDCGRGRREKSWSVVQQLLYVRLEVKPSVLGLHD